MLACMTCGKGMTASPTSKSPMARDRHSPPGQMRSGPTPLSMRVAGPAGRDHEGGRCGTGEPREGEPFSPPPPQKKKVAKARLCRPLRVSMYSAAGNGTLRRSPGAWRAPHPSRRSRWEQWCCPWPPPAAARPCASPLGGPLRGGGQVRGVEVGAERTFSLAPPQTARRHLTADWCAAFADTAAPPQPSRQCTCLPWQGLRRGCTRLRSQGTAWGAARRAPVSRCDCTPVSSSARESPRLATVSSQPTCREGGAPGTRRRGSGVRREAGVSRAGGG